eukprot:TRINITY_DN7050_c0_g1_i1.p1 TRINITY_DN7050_c0_g1~~TRINITY_DN7050_c0_g1_i1.p1  ORF type:complete len:1033 (-),score=161.17 TRINITY_DN7050_c0_g1_i1:18-3116(-)
MIPRYIDGKPSPLQTNRLSRASSTHSRHSSGVRFSPSADSADVVIHVPLSDETDTVLHGISPITMPLGSTSTESSPVKPISSDVSASLVNLSERHCWSAPMFLLWFIMFGLFVIPGIYLCTIANWSNMNVVVSSRFPALSGVVYMCYFLPVSFAFAVLLLILLRFLPAVTLLLCLASLPATLSGAGIYFLISPGHTGPALGWALCFAGAGAVSIALVVACIRHARVRRASVMISHAMTAMTGAVETVSLVVLHMLRMVAYVAIWSTFLMAGTLVGHCENASPPCVWRTDIWPAVYCGFLYAHLAWSLIYGAERRLAFVATLMSMRYFKAPEGVWPVLLSYVKSTPTVVLSSIIPYGIIAAVRRIAHGLRHMSRAGCCCGCVSCGDCLWRITAHLSRFGLVHHAINGDDLMYASQSSAAVLKKTKLPLFVSDIWALLALRVLPIAAASAVGLVFWYFFGISAGFAVGGAAACFVIIDALLALPLYILDTFVYCYAVDRCLGACHNEAFHAAMDQLAPQHVAHQTQVAIIGPITQHPDANDSDDDLGLTPPPVLREMPVTGSAAHTRQISQPLLEVQPRVSRSGRSASESLRVANTLSVPPAPSPVDRKHDVTFKEGVLTFHRSARQGLAFFAEHHYIQDPEDPMEIARFLMCEADLSKDQIGEFLGGEKTLNLAVLECFTKLQDFTGQGLDEALRKFLMGFRLPGEAQKIDRIVERYAQQYCLNNPGAFSCTDTAYVLAFSLIMLNTDAHNPNVRSKMTREEFVRNNRGIDNGADLPRSVLEPLYDRIVSNEIQMHQPTAQSAAVADANFTFMNTTKQGWLVKRGRGNIAAWNKRWFMLVGSVLYYFGGPGETTKPRGIIPLENLQVVDISERHVNCFTLRYADGRTDKIKSCKLGEHGELVSGVHQKFIMCAENEAELHAWIDVLQAAVISNPFALLSEQRRALIRRRSSIAVMPRVRGPDEMTESAAGAPPLMDELLVQSPPAAQTSSVFAGDAPSLPLREHDHDDDNDDNVSETGSVIIHDSVSDNDDEE